MRPILRGLLLSSPLLFQVGCLGLKTKPKAKSPPPLTVPSTAAPKTLRSQKPEPPPVIGLPKATLADGEIAVRVVAYVNNIPIFDTELREGLMLRLRELEGLSDTEREHKLKELRAQELEKLIEREVVMDAANARLKKMPARIMEDLQREASKEFDRRIKDLREAYKLTNEEQLRNFFVQQGMSISNFKRSVERSFISMEFMRNIIFPKLQFMPLSEVRAYYEAHPEEFTEKDQAKWKDIVIDAAKFPNRDAARRYADQVSTTLRGGADFTAVARQLQEAGYNYLLSDEGIGEKPGEIKPAELQTAVFALPPGQVSAPVEVAGGFHIVKVVERKKSGKRPLDADTQNEIRAKLQNLLASKEYKRLVEEMKEKALIQRLE